MKLIKNSKKSNNNLRYLTNVKKENTIMPVNRKTIGDEMSADNEFFEEVIKFLNESLKDKTIKGRSTAEITKKAIKAAILKCRESWHGQQIYICKNTDYNERNSKIRRAYRGFFKKVCDEHNLSFNQVLKIIRDTPNSVKK